MAAYARVHYRFFTLVLVLTSIVALSAPFSSPTRAADPIPAHVPPRTPAAGIADAPAEPAEPMTHSRYATPIAGKMPWKCGQAVRVTQDRQNSGNSHYPGGVDAWARDLDTSGNWPIYAARNGTVVSVESNYGPVPVTVDRPHTPTASWSTMATGRQVSTCTC